jgi:hypothetical protein
MQHKESIRLALATALLLLIPLVAMQFTDEVVWSLADFVVAGVLLFGTGLAFELVARKGGTFAYRAAVGVACAAALLLIWLNLAVGLIGSEDHPANLMYIGVLAIAFIGAYFARFRPLAMSRALFATALAQTLVTAIVMIAWELPASSGVAEVVGVNAFFVALWVVSALLFRHAGDHSFKIQKEERGRGTT